ncbi:DUF4340 domain-containing protein [Spirulina subsalsa FACHB-351]|uniref:DUF4340 domain-containing protein n=1 Tax=Spirulina subsalsa FACHB-351 TaxID=234711 RepID=A0ABT3L1W6_9CYAN|nr:DUF4340 domain-containing protein [Spirulina subsalsa]MCW6035496.1 DUF4340 domain-containing protein [Spirulina subsalsa FACHB-351]
MKLQRTTWGLLMAALVLGGGVYFYEMIVRSYQTEVVARQRKVIDLKEQDIQEITIEKEGRTLQFERVEAETYNWRMVKPQEEIANDAAIAFLTNLLVEKERDRMFLIAAEEKDTYGLEEPFATLTLKVAGEDHTLILGRPNFDQKWVYAQINPPSETPEELEVTLIPIEFRYAVERDLNEWRRSSR